MGRLPGDRQPTPGVTTDAWLLEQVRRLVDTLVPLVVEARGRGPDVDAAVRREVWRLQALADGHGDGSPWPPVVGQWRGASRAGTGSSGSRRRAGQRPVPPASAAVTRGSGPGSHP